MRNGLLGAFCALILAGIGFFWWQGRAEVERGAPPPLVEPTESADDSQLPSADATDLRGPEPPEATELTREQRRFFRCFFPGDNDASGDRVETELGI